MNHELIIAKKDTQIANQEATIEKLRRERAEAERDKAYALRERDAFLSTVKKQDKLIKSLRAAHKQALIDAAFGGEDD